ncbi:MAG: hypothetical protein ACLTLQ_19785 [[Clostridium] scindens]
MVLFFRVVTITILIAYAIYMYRDIIKHKEKDSFFHMILYGIMGFVLNLLDTLGVGSNATQMAFFKLTKLSPDEHLPANGNVIFAIPVGVEFLLFLDIVEVDTVTLITMLVSSVLGAIVRGEDCQQAAGEYLEKDPGCHTALRSGDSDLQVKRIRSFWHDGGRNRTYGRQARYRHCSQFCIRSIDDLRGRAICTIMALCALLGMNISVAFPIMMGSCAFLMPPASVEFVKSGKYNRPAAAIATITGIFGVLAAYYIVKSMPITLLTWIVAAVLIYMSISFVLTLKKEK